MAAWPRHLHLVPAASASAPRCSPAQGGVAAIRQALAQVDRRAVKAVAVSGQQHGLVALDASGQVRPPARRAAGRCPPPFSSPAQPPAAVAAHPLITQVLRPAKLWCDTESAAEAAELSRALGATIVPSFTATKVLWLKRNEPQLFERLATVLLPHDYFNFYLTGRYAMEVRRAAL